MAEIYEFKKPERKASAPRFKFDPLEVAKIALSIFTVPNEAEVIELKRPEKPANEA